MVTLTIDGKDVTVAENSTILDAAAQLGIRIPTLCFLKKVSPTGACRICAVGIEGVGRPMTACNTPVKEGIRVTTQSEQLVAIRRKMVELLLVKPSPRLPGLRRRRRVRPAGCLIRAGRGQAGVCSIPGPSADSL